MAEYTVTLGTSSTITLPAAPSGYTWTGQGTTPPAGMTYKPSTTNVQRIEGTPTAAGTTTRTLDSDDGYGTGPSKLEVTVTVAEPEPITRDVDVPTTIPLDELKANAGVTGTRWELVTYGTAVTEWPPGMTGDSATGLSGTPTTAGLYSAALEDWNDGTTVLAQIAVVSSVVTIPVPAAERTEDGYMLPEAEGVVWTVDGVDTEPGTYSVQPVTEPTTVTILPRPAEGYVFDAEPEPLVLTYEPAPDPDPEPEPWEPPARPEGDYPGPWPAPAGPEPNPDDESVWSALLDDDPQAMFVAGRLSERIIRHAGMDVADLDPAEVLTARDHAMTVLEYVKGYTRDRGFIGYVPHRSLQAVIVAAGARLFVNPEQMTYYSTGDYSERPATMTGWTSAELGVLRRFRKVFA